MNSFQRFFAVLAMTSFSLILSGCGDWKENSGQPSCCENPGTSFSVQSISPSSSATNVSRSTAVTITFSDVVDATTVTTTSAQLMKGGVSVLVSTVTNNATVTMTPTNALSYLSTYTVVLTTSVKSRTGTALATEYRSTFTTENEPVIPSALGVVSITPADGATQVSLSSRVLMTFSDVIDVNTVNVNSIRLTKDGVSIPVTTLVDGATVTMTPASPLSYLTSYTVVVTTAVKSQAGSSLATEFHSTFTTESEPVVVPNPTVTSVTPANGATNVLRSTVVTLTFSELMDATSVTADSVKVMNGSAVVAGALTTSGATVTMTPASPLSYLTPYTVVVTTAVKSEKGKYLATEFRSSFTTESEPVVIPAPTVVSITPAQGATNVLRSTVVTIVFSETIDASTVTSDSVKVMKGSTTVSGALVVSGVTVTMTPANPLSYLSSYTVVISTGVKSQAGKSLPAEFTSTFTTESEPPIPYVPFTLDAQYHITGVTTDSAGKVYVYGYFGSPVTDIFVASFEVNGSLRWISTVVTSVTDWPQGGIVVADGYVYIQRIRDPLESGSTEIFVDKFSATNGALLWSTLVDSASMASSIATDGTYVYATTTKATVKLDSSGTIVTRSTTGGSANAFAFGGVLVAGASYVDSAKLTDRYLMRFDSGLVKTWEAWRTDALQQDVRGLGFSVTDSLFFVAEDSFSIGSSSVTFSALVTAYRVLDSGARVESAWTVMLPENFGRISTAASDVDGNFYVATEGTTRTLLKLVGNTGVTSWAVTLPADAYCIAFQTSGSMLVSDGTSALRIFNPQTGARE